MAIVIDRGLTDGPRRELLNYYIVLDLTEPMAKREKKEKEIERRHFDSSPRNRKATGVRLTVKLPVIFPSNFFAQRTPRRQREAGLP